MAQKSKPVRVVEIVKTHERPTYEWGAYQQTHWRYKQHHYRVRAGSRNGQVLYHSEAYGSKQGAIKAARREHEGRSRFQYVLEYKDRSGNLVTEKLK